ncbi:MAG: S8 family peptidase [Pseudonocardiaceae bacterium]
MENDRDTPVPAASIYSDPVFQAFTIKTTGGRTHQKANKAVKDVLGDGWELANYGGRGDNFEVFKEEGALTSPQAWEAAYRLRAHQGITSAEPVFKAWVTDRRDWGINLEPAPESETLILDWLCGPGNDFQVAKPNEWSLDLTKVKQAWTNHFPGQNNKEGDGIVIGHPDTGYRKHPEIATNLLAGSGFDFFRNDTDPTDELDAGFGKNPGHGTGTASVIVSPKGPPGGTPPNFVSGAAPAAKLIPFRVSDSVVIVDTLNLARAIEKAADVGAHVISISMGGLGSQRLHDAVVYAKNKGAIVLAAAGNCVRYVVYPAAYEEVAAVAACDAEKGIWKGTSRGAAVDVTAPGDRVWHAVANANDSVDNVEQGSGTSYAVATVAGIAALWLAKHGRSKIIQACGGREKIAAAFTQLLRTTATPVPGWPAGQFGGGLVNADKLLAAPLPGSAANPLMLAAPEDHAPVGRGGLTTFSHLFDEAMSAGLDGRNTFASDQPIDSRARLNNRLAVLLNTTEGKLPSDLGQVGQELAFYLATDPTLYGRFATVMSPRSSQAPEASDAPAGEASGAPEENLDQLRQQLLRKGVSQALGEKLLIRV